MISLQLIVLLLERRIAYEKTKILSPQNGLKLEKVGLRLALKKS